MTHEDRLISIATHYDVIFQTLGFVGHASDEAQISPLLKQYFLVKVYILPLKILFFPKYGDCRLQTEDKMQTENCRLEVKCRLGFKTNRFPGQR